MAISLASLQRTTAVAPPRLLVHGVAGVGKTTFAAGADRAVIIPTEDGLGALEAEHFPLARSFGEVMEALAALYSENHEFRTVVVDSVDWLEPLVWKAVCQQEGWASIEEPGYGKGYVAALDLWRQYLDGLNALRDERGMTVVQIAHTDIKRFDSPEHEPYDRYVIKLHARAAALLQEHSDVVLFANYRISTVKSDVGFNKKVTRALGSGERVLYTAERPAFLAKNRYGLPDMLPLDWASLRRGDAAAHPHPVLTSRRPLMANLGTTFDATSVDPTTSYEVLPPGKYTVQIVQSEMRPTKDGNGQYLWLELDVLDGPHQGRKLFDRLNLVNASAQTVEIAQRTLSAICHATGRLQVQDSQELHLIPMTANVTVQPPKNGYGESNKIRYQPLKDGQAAPPATAAPAKAPAPAAPAAPATSFASAPWKRSA